METTTATVTENDSQSEIVSDLIENPGVRYTMVTLHIVAIVLASLGNGFLIVFILRHWRQTHRNVTAILILNLAACDFINAACYQPMRLVDILVGNEDHLTYCQVSGFFSSFIAGVGFMLIVAIAQERFLLICCPFRAKRLLTLRNTAAVMAAIWAGVLVCAVPIPVGFVYVIEVRLESGVARFCLVNLSEMDSFRGDVYFACLFTMFFAVPLTVIMFSYVKIFRTLRNALPGQKDNSRGMTRLLRQRQSLAKVMLSTAVIFVVSQGPHWMTSLISVCGYEIKNNPIFTLLLVDLLTMISPCMNPIVYSIRYNTVKKGITRSGGGGGSIYSALRRASTRRSSAPPSDTPLTSFHDDSDAAGDARKAQGSAAEEDNGACLPGGERPSPSPPGRSSSCRSRTDGRPPFRQTIYASNGKVFRYSVTSV